MTSGFANSLPMFYFSRLFIAHVQVGHAWTCDTAVVRHIKKSKFSSERQVKNKDTPNDKYLYRVAHFMTSPKKDFHQKAT